MSPRDFYLDPNPTPARPGGGPRRPTEKTAFAPSSTYEVVIDWVKTATTQDGHERWRFRMVVNNGKHVGKFAAYDSLTWKDGNAANRIKVLLKALGLPHSGRINCTPDQIKNIPFIVTTEDSTYFGKDGVMQPNVPFDGFQALAAKDAETKEADFDGIPF